jgi:ABC-type nitrate/sulfonate/bicarbonate transport system permease component
LSEFLCVNVGATKYRADRDDYGIYIYMGTLIGTGVGAVSGLLFGQSRRSRDLVYDAR